MTTATQQGTVFRHFRADASHDVSADTLELSTDGGETWSSTGVEYVAPEDWPPEVVAANAASKVRAGYVGYWWRILTGPDGDWPLPVGQKQQVRGRLTDNPETPHFVWYISVLSTE